MSFITLFRIRHYMTRNLLYSPQRFFSSTEHSYNMNRERYFGQWWKWTLFLARYWKEALPREGVPAFRLLTEELK